MKLLLSILITSLFLFAPDLSKVRVAYINAVNDKENTENLHNELKGLVKSDAKILLAYKGAVTTLMAKFANTTKEKKDFFKEGATLLEYAVLEDPNNIEIRYLRLGVQENAPKVVGYHKNKLEDKQYILDHYGTISSKELKRLIKDFVVQSETFSEEEKKLISE